MRIASALKTRGPFGVTMWQPTIDGSLLMCDSDPFNESMSVRPSTYLFKMSAVRAAKRYGRRVRT